MDDADGFFLGRNNPSVARGADPGSPDKCTIARESLELGLHRGELLAIADVPLTPVGRR
jgi:hypothetical protein